ncbi:MAG: hypothetical protein HY814_13115 [Candidatus Riflebacteria bacterium]|nr:hypothetical protein [Candidatus Riflebacteria bacterium]
MDQADGLLRDSQQFFQAAAPFALGVEDESALRGLRTLVVRPENQRLQVLLVNMCRQLQLLNAENARLANMQTGPTFRTRGLSSTVTRSGPAPTGWPARQACLKGLLEDLRVQCEGLDGPAELLHAYEELGLVAALLEPEGYTRLVDYLCRSRGVVESTLGAERAQQLRQAWLALARTSGEVLVAK